MVESGGHRFKLDPKDRLASFRAKHFALPPDWHLQVDRPPALWFGHVIMLMLEALLPAMMDRVAPRATDSRCRLSGAAGGETCSRAGLTLDGACGTFGAGGRISVARLGSPNFRITSVTQST